VANDKARKDRAIARNYQRKKVERRKNWLKFVIKLQKKNVEREPSVENPKSIENKGQEEILSPLTPPQLYLVQLQTSHK
jgi:hypothetical protein